MIIYISHSRDFDYKNELYIPLRASSLNNQHTIILPHEKSQKYYNSKDLFKDKKCDVVVAEISYPSVGQGIELGWASAYNIPIISMYKTGSNFSGSAVYVSKKKIEYVDNKDIILQLEHYFKYEHS